MCACVRACVRGERASGHTLVRAFVRACGVRAYVENTFAILARWSACMNIWSMSASNMVKQINLFNKLHLRERWTSSVLRMKLPSKNCLVCGCKHRNCVANQILVAKFIICD